MNHKRLMHWAALLLAVAALLACGGQRAAKVKIVVIGFDGAGWPTIEPLIAAGKLPGLAELRSRSAWADFTTFKPTKSHVVWTTIATGRPMTRHGIMDFTYINQQGVELPVTKSKRVVPAIWQILDHWKMRSVVVNWFVTTPPDQFNGVMISDSFRRLVLKPEMLEEMAKEVEPASYFPRLKRAIPADYTDFTAVLKQTAMPDYQQLVRELHPDYNFAQIPVLPHYQTHLKQDYLIEKLSDHLYETEKCDVFMTYFRLPDITQHFMTSMLTDEYKARLKEAYRTGVDLETIKQEGIHTISMAMEPVYRRMETIIRRYMDNPAYRDAYFMIMSDHGFSFYASGYDHVTLPEDCPAPAGILMVLGPQVKPGKMNHASVLDITPTMLYLEDLPVARDMEGRPLQEAFKWTRRIRYTSTYPLSRKGKSEADNQQIDAMRRELESLNYISGKSPTKK